MGIQTPESSVVLKTASTESKSLPRAEGYQQRDETKTSVSPVPQDTKKKV